MDSIIQNIASTRSTKVIVVTDGERIWGWEIKEQVDWEFL
ncbi:hypothetical protein PGH43_15995 [Legionella pneumophila 130b]|nr:hypothetical protein PGH43_15995 [Legionella pneumophila 130b]